jgi:predicted  nucleic acid-binding Zn-ribbon protein
MKAIDNLIQLQDIDSQLQEIKEILGDAPAKVEELIQEEEQLKTNLEDGKVRIKEILVALNKAEITVAEDTEKVAKLKDQLFLVSNNRQYDAMMAEIDHIKEKLDKDETLNLELLEERDTLVEKIKTQETDLVTLSKALRGRRVSLEEMIKESADQKKVLEKEREDALKNIDKAHLDHYKKVSAARGGVAVVKIQGNGCGGCGSNVPLQKQSEIKSKKFVRTCDECSRFLFWENEL